jgi:hypothetical protein
MKTIIEMAREAGWGQAKPHDDCITCGVFDLEAFAELVRADEREECAVTADEHMQECEGKSFGVGKAIRARGQA